MSNYICDICDICGNEIVDKSGLRIDGENIETKVIGSQKKKDIFSKDGQYAPMNGKVSFTICKECLMSNLD